MNAPGEPAGKVARAISETTDTVLLGRACMCTASHETPRKSEIAIPPITASVVAAFFPCGGLKAPTPFEIDSDARQRGRARGERPQDDEDADPAGRSGRRSGRRRGPCGQLPSAHFAIPGPDQHVHRPRRSVGGQRERDARLPHAAQVDDREEQDERERELDLVRGEGRRRRGDREDPGRDRHRRRSARSRRGARPRRPGSAACRGSPSRRRTRRRSSRTPCTVCVYERTTIASTAAIAIEIGRTRCGAADRRADEDDQRRLGRVGDRRQRVGGEDRQREVFERSVSPSSAVAVGGRSRRASRAGLGATRAPAGFSSVCGHRPATLVPRGGSNGLSSAILRAS